MSCGNALHGAQLNANSITLLSKLLERESSLPPILLLLPPEMVATNMLIAINVLLLMKVVKNVVGASVVLLTIRVSDQLHSNAVVSKLEHHMLSPVQLISELLTARVMLAIFSPRNAQSVMTVNSQILLHALKFVIFQSHMLNVTSKRKNAMKNANQDKQAASTKITATSTAQHQNKNAMLVPVNVKTVTKPLTQNAKF